MSSDLADDEVYCRDCGAVINERAEICPECGIRQKEPESSGSGEKNPGLAAAASFVIPGLGQVYNGSIAKGIIGGVFFFVLVFSGVGIILAIPLWIVLIYDAYKQAQNDDRDDKNRSGGTVEIDRSPDPTDTPEVVDYVLQWYVKNEASHEEVPQIGGLRRKLNEQGLSGLSESDLTSSHGFTVVAEVPERRISPVAAYDEYGRYCRGTAGLPCRRLDAVSIPGLRNEDQRHLSE